MLNEEIRVFVLSVGYCRGNDMYPVFWTPILELNKSFHIKDASLNFMGGIHFVLA